MLIEYQVEVRNGAVTITQRVELGNATFAATQQPSAEKKPDAEQGKVSMLELPQSFNVQQSPPVSVKPKSGGGDHDPAGTGGGPGSGLVVVFGPLVVTPSGRTGSGGGDHDPAGTGGTGDKIVAS
jgi:hypothetical protein